MKIKAILLVFIFIIISSFLFSILSSKTNTQNNKIFYVESFIKAIKDQLVPPATIVKDHLKISKDTVKSGYYPQIITQLLEVRRDISAARAEELEITPYKELPEKEQTIVMAPDASENVFIVKYHGKKVMSVMVGQNKITAFKTLVEGPKEVFIAL